MPELSDPAILARLVCAHLDVDPRALRFTPISTGRHNRSYWVDGDQGRYVLRIAPPDDIGLLFYERRMMRQEPRLHALIRDKTTIPVAQIVGYDFSRTLLDRDYLLMTVLPGTPLSSARRLTQRQLARALQQVGAYLRELHDLTAVSCLGMGAYGYLGAHQPMEPRPAWVDAFHVMWNKLLDDVVACGSYTSEEARHLRDQFERFRMCFDHPVTASLLHMDIWSENILVDEQGNVKGLVDFDRALWGDVEIEFAVLDYCGISEPPFWSGYGREREDSPAALTRRQFYLLYEVQKYMPISIWRSRDPARAARYKQTCGELVALLDKL